MEGLKALLIAKFKMIMMEVANQLLYLRRQLKWNGTMIFAAMDFYLEQVLSGYKLLKKRSAPGGKDTFVVVTVAEVLVETKRKEFHSIMARLLYLAKRVRPDILVVISFLSTWVMRASRICQNWKSCWGTC